MTQSYAQIQRQIEALQKQADKLRKTEVSGVVERIKVAIDHYGLTSDQLFGTSSVEPRVVSSRAVQPRGKSARTRNALTTAYTDGSGNTWGGRGPRPRWLREALAAGKSLEDFASDAASAVSSAGGTKQIASKSQAKRKARTSYSDEHGNSWSGFGPKPGWLKEALAAGKAIEGFAATASKI